MGRWKRRSSSKRHTNNGGESDLKENNDNSDIATTTATTTTSTFAANDLHNNVINDSDNDNNNTLLLNNGSNNNNASAIENEKTKSMNEDSNKDTRSVAEQQLSPTNIRRVSFQLTTPSPQSSSLEEQISSSSSSKKQHIYYFFNSLEKVQIRVYLENYRNIALGKQVNHNNNNTMSTKIGGHQFPNIYDTEVLNSTTPYLKLPISLNGKHRRFLHEICLDVGLYHDSYNEVTTTTTTSNNHYHHHRCMAVSIHIDGLLQILQTQFNHDNEHPLIPLHICQPWFYQYPNENENDHHITPIKSNRTTVKPDNTSLDHLASSSDFFVPTCHVQQSTIAFQKTIRKYVENPSLCIRDIHEDLLDFMIDDKQRLLLSNTIPSPLPCDPNTWMYVDSVDKMKQCLNEIEELNPKEIGFDLEMYNKDKYTCITCLLQLSTTQKTYVIDPKATPTTNITTISQTQHPSPKIPVETVWNTIPKLSKFFSDPNIIKIGHSINSMDVPSLYRDFGLILVNVFDTMEAAKILKLRKSGLAAVCEYYKLTPPNDPEYASLKQLYQRQDWRRRPLKDDMLRYARYDVYYLIQLRQFMVRDVLLMDEPERVQLTKKNKMHNRDILNKTSSELKSTSHTLAKNMSERENKLSSTPSTTPAVVNTNDDETSCIISHNISDEEGHFTSTQNDSYSPNDRNSSTNRRNINEGDDDSITNDDDTSEDDDHLLNLTLSEIQKYYKSYLTVLSKSQKNCLCFWGHKVEPHSKNESKRDILKKEGPRWTTSQDYLYNALIQWRNKVAYTKYHTMPGLIISTEILVYIAYKRPTTCEELRFVSFVLPQVLEYDLDCRNDVLLLVKSSLEREVSSSSPLLLQRREHLEFETKATPVMSLTTPSNSSQESSENNTTYATDVIGEQQNLIKDDESSSSDSGTVKKKIQPSLETKLLQYSAATLAIGAVVVTLIHYTRRRGQS